MELRESVFLKDFASNIMFFLFLSVLITYISNKVPEAVYYYKGWLFKEREWEKGGQFYQDKLKVKNWKKHMPELGDFVKSVFPKKYIREYSKEYLLVYLTESCKAELTHWAIILSTLIMGLWNDFNMTLLMLIIAFSLNIPFVIIQRFNRPRILRIMKPYEIQMREKENPMGISH